LIASRVYRTVVCYRRGLNFYIVKVRTNIEQKLLFGVVSCDFFGRGILLISNYSFYLDNVTVLFSIVSSILRHRYRPP